MTRKLPNVASCVPLAPPAENQLVRPMRRPPLSRRAFRVRWSHIVHHPPSSLQCDLERRLVDSRTVCPTLRINSV